MPKEKQGLRAADDRIGKPACQRGNTSGTRQDQHNAGTDDWARDEQRRQRQSHDDGR